MTPPVRSALDLIRGLISHGLDELMTRLPEGWRQKTNDIDRLQRGVELQREVVREAELAKELCYARRQQVEASVLSRRQLRLVPTSLYVIVLAAAATTQGILNVAALRVLQLHEPVIIVLAVMLSIMFAISIHVIPQGLDSERRRDPTFLAALLLLLLLLSLGVLLGFVQQDTTRELWRPSNWVTALLLGLATSSALLAAFMHQGKAATALRRAWRDAAIATADLRRAKELLQDMEHRLERARHQRVALVDEVLSEVQRSDREAKGLQMSFIETLQRLRPDIDWPTDIPPIPVPASVQAWEEWLRKEAARIGHPTHASGRFPAAVDARSRQ